MSLIAEVIKLNPDEAAVIHWFNEERLPFLLHMTPAEALASGRLDSLQAYIRSLDTGSSG